MDNKKMLIALVAVVAIVGVAAFALMGGDDDTKVETDTPGPDTPGPDTPGPDTPGPEEETAEGFNFPVYGNANNDMYIDEKDIAKIKEIIGSGWDKATNKYADANHDGVVDQADVDTVQRMMNKEAGKIWFTDALQKDNWVNYPITNIILTGYETMFGIEVFDKQNDVVGRDDMKIPFLRDEMLFKTIYDKAAPISTSPFKLDMGLVTEVLEKNKNVTFITNESYCMKEQPALEKLGVQTVRTNFMSIDKCFESALTLGYLLGNEDKAHEFVDFMSGWLNEVLDTVAGLPAAEKQVKSLMNVWGNNLYSTKAPESKLMETAGCVNPLTPEMIGGEDDKAISKGSEWNLGPEFNVPYMIVEGPFKYSTTLEEYAQKWDDGMEQADWDKMMKDHYKTGIFIIDYNVHKIILLSYMAEALHADAFAENFTDDKHQQFVDKFMPDLVAQNYKVSEHYFSVCYDDIKDLVKSN